MFGKVKWMVTPECVNLFLDGGRNLEMIEKKNQLTE